LEVTIKQEVLFASSIYNRIHGGDQRVSPSHDSGIASSHLACSFNGRILVDFISRFFNELYKNDQKKPMSNGLEYFGWLVADP
jgi:hypothetical protein